jgi:hypothetical protein
MTAPVAHPGASADRTLPESRGCEEGLGLDKPGADE